MVEERHVFIISLFMIFIAHLSNSYDKIPLIHVSFEFKT